MSIYLQSNANYLKAMYRYKPLGNRNTFHTVINQLKEYTEEVNRGSSGIHSNIKRH